MQISRHEYFDKQRDDRQEFFEKLRREAPIHRRNAKRHAIDRVDYYVGLAVNQVSQPSALAVVSVCFDWNIKDTRYAVIHTEQFPVGAPYPEIVGRAAEVYCDVLAKESYGRALAVDGTNIGMALWELLDARIPEADYARYTVEQTAETKAYAVAQQDILVTRQRLAQEDRLDVAQDFPDSRVIVNELKTSRIAGQRPARIAALEIALWHSEWWKYATWPGYQR